MPKSVDVTTTATADPPAESTAAASTGTDDDVVGEATAAAPKANEPRKLNPAGMPISCSCRKNQCIKLYCACFDAGVDCFDDCKCQKCKNNPRARAKKEEKKVIEAKKDEKRKMDIMAAAKEEATMLLTVSPGRLGLTLKLDRVNGGVLITEIDPACTLKQLEVGDRIVTIDGIKITSIADLDINKGKIRKFGIAKKKDTTETNNKKDLMERLKPNKSTNFYETKPHQREKKQTFPMLTEFNAIDLDRTSSIRRRAMLTELLQFDKRNNIPTVANMGAFEYQILYVPLSRRESVNKREMDNKAFHAYNKQTKLMDKFIDSWAKWCDGTREDAANMILYHMAKKFPSSYVKNFEMATKKHEKTAGGQHVALPPDFVAHDGTNDIKWNSKYSELIKYREQNGDCMVYTKTDLGRWVCLQRTQYQNKAKTMTEKRIQLLEQLDFRWRGVPDHWAKATPGGNPTQCRALAAKLVYPQLSIRECLLLGGFTREELDAVKDPKHTWRTGYVYYKDMVVKKLKDWDTAQRRGARIQTEQLIGILEGEDEDKVEQVFGETSVLLPEFLANAEEREKNGESADKIKQRTKRSYNDANDIQQEVQQDYAAKMPRIDTVGVDYSTHTYPQQGHPQYDMAAHAQQLNSWRAQGGQNQWHH